MSSVNLDTADNLSITCKQGDTFELTLTLKDSSGTALPLVTDDYKFLMQVRKRGSNYDGVVVPRDIATALRVPVNGGGGEADYRGGDPRGGDQCRSRREGGGDGRGDHHQGGD